MATRSRKVVCTKVHIMEGGEEQKSAGRDSVAVEFRFKNGNTLRITPEDVHPDLHMACMLHGVAQKVGDTYAKSTSVDEAQSHAETMLGRLKDGEWTSERVASGPRIGDLLEAIRRAKIEAGKEFDEDASRKKLLADADFRKGAAANPHVARHLAAIKLEKARDEASRAAEAAEGSEESIEDL